MPLSVARPWWRRPELIIPSAYLAIAGSWVALSDQLITDHVKDPALVQRLEIEKDLLFVAVTALLLYGGLRAALERLQAEARRRIDAERQFAAELRRLADRLAHAREEEQACIARDLHDDLGQLVTGLSLTLRSSARLAAGLPAGPAATTLVELNQMSGELAKQVLVAIQRIAAGLRPPSLEQLDVGVALGQELRRLEGRAGWRGSLRVEAGLPDLPGPVATALFRIGQEALTNVARHAEARCVEVALRLQDGAAVLEVEDDGIGVGRPEAGSLGLLGMSERATALGGDVTVRPGPARGTIVAARIPLVQAGQQAAS